MCARRIRDAVAVYSALMTSAYRTAAGPCQESITQAPSVLAASVDPQFSVHQQRTRRSLIDAHNIVHSLDIARNSKVLRNHDSTKRTAKTTLVRRHDQQLKEEEGE